MSDVFKLSNGQGRQGDVYIKRIEEIPKGMKTIDRDNGRVILAYGEVTGHAHAISDEPAKLLSHNGKRVDEEMYLDTDEDVTISHEEHDAFVIPAGKYRVVRQREYSPFGERYVAD